MLLGWWLSLVHKDKHVLGTHCRKTTCLSPFPLSPQHILGPDRRGLAEDSIHTRRRIGPQERRDQVCDRSSHRADCPHSTSAEDTWKDGRRFLPDKTAVVAVGRRKADSSRQKEKKIISLPTVQCQKIHREAQGWEGTGQPM